MNFEEWEKKHSSEICPHTPKQLGYAVTRCRQCVWDAAQKEMEKDAGIKISEILAKGNKEVKAEARREMAEKYLGKLDLDEEEPCCGYNIEGHDELCPYHDLVVMLEKEAKG